MQDGDIITIMDGRRQVRVRLPGIDCPQRGQAYGNRAREFTGDLAFGKRVTIRVRGIDRYAGLVGAVTLLDGRNLNHQPDPGRAGLMA